MTLHDLQKRTLHLENGLQGLNAKVERRITLTLDKEPFKALLSESGATLNEPTNILSEYWFVITISEWRWFINFKPQKTITYESL